MPSADEIHAELEADRGSREAEIRLIERFITEAEGASRDMLKRSLILLTYAHLEGFCKFSLLSYAAAINALQLSCAAVTPAVAAASLSNVFASLRDPQRKHPAFRGAAEVDAFLQLAYREQKFIEDFHAVVAERVNIPDSHIDTKSNLDTDVLRKMLFRMGLNFDLVEEHRANLNKLLGVRNAIAHGDRIKVPKDQDLQTYLASALQVMRFLQDLVYRSLEREIFRKPAG